MGNRAQDKGMEGAQAAQEQAAIENRQLAQNTYADINGMLKVYRDAGPQSLKMQQDILGINGPEAQQSAYDLMRKGPAYQTMLKEGERGILQNASATGNLRGGNTQDALSRYAPTLLNSLMQQQYGNLGGITGLGANAVQLQSNAALNAAQLGMGARSAQGSATASGLLAQGRGQSDMYSGIGDTFQGLLGGGGSSNSITKFM